MSKDWEWYRKYIEYKENRRKELDKILKDGDEEALKKWIEEGKMEQSQFHT